GAEALAAYAEALQQHPDNPMLLNEVGVLQRNLGKLTDATATFGRAAELQLGSADALVNLGIACQDQGHADRSIACFRKAIKLDPDHLAAHQSLLLALTRAWDTTPQQVYEAHVAFGRQFDPSPRPRPGLREWQGRAIRVGYLSPDFRDH